MKCLMNAWNKYEPQVFAWLLGRTRNRQEAEDIMQDVFLKAMKNSDRFCTLDDAKPWIFKMVKNQYIDRLRKQVETENLDDVSNLPPSPVPSQEVFIRMQRCLPPVLKQLKPVERHIIEACDLEGVKQAEYAQQNGLTLAATKSKLQRARKVLKQQLVDYCNVVSVDERVCCFGSNENSVDTSN